MSVKIKFTFCSILHSGSRIAAPCLSFEPSVPVVTLLIKAHPDGRPAIAACLGLVEKRAVEAEYLLSVRELVLGRHDAASSTKRAHVHALAGLPPMSI